MSQYMPTGGFKWVEATLEGLELLNDTSEVGRIYEVDISYPIGLHKAHNELPFLPDSKTPPGSKIRKLLATLESKKYYIIHYKNLKQALTNGLIVDNVNIFIDICFYLCFILYVFYIGTPSIGIQAVGLASRIH